MHAIDEAERVDLRMPDEAAPPLIQASADVPSGSALLGCTLVLAGVVLWATIGVTIRWVTADAAAVAFWRGLGGGVAALGFLLVRSPISRWASRFAIGPAGGWVVACSVAGTLLFIVAVRLSSVADAATIYGSLPFIAAAIAWLGWREACDRATLLAAAIALLGVLVTVGGGLNLGASTGHLVAIAVVLAYGGQIVLLCRHPTIPVLPVVALTSLSCAALALFVARPWAVPDREIAVLLASGILQGVVGDWLCMRGAQMLSPARTALLGTLETPLGATAAWIALGEQPAAETVVGAGLIVSAVVGHVLARHATTPPGA